MAQANTAQIQAQTNSKLDPNERQRLASDPTYSAWVGASAGSGKTKVLTDRVLRLLLPNKNQPHGLLPHKLLCITFTKAAASEMKDRLNRRLSRWATISEEELAQDIKNLQGFDANEKQMDVARSLFGTVLDLPDGLKIMTIHSFCQSLLGRFPLEAGLMPHFKAIDEKESANLLSRARDDILSKAQAEPDTPLGRALSTIARNQSEDGFLSLLQSIMAESQTLNSFLDDDNQLDIALFHKKICGALKIDDGWDETTYIRYACADDQFAANDLWHLSKLMQTVGKGKNEPSNGLLLQRWLEGTEGQRAELFDGYKEIFLTKKNTKRQNFPTVSIKDNDERAENIVDAEADRLVGIENVLKNIRIARLTTDLFLVALSIWQNYKLEKEKVSAVDFDDLINKAHRLLQNESTQGWVMYKLDGGIDHILVDEAQDTNPEQWSIIKDLASDFFSGKGRQDEIDRTVFAVGDEKQSIYSFQRAAPEKFSESYEYFLDKANAAGKSLRRVNMDISFRSVPEILDFVDRVFLPLPVQKGVGSARLKHYSFKNDLKGAVELWPLFEDQEAAAVQPWAVPDKIIQSQSGSARLADYIGQTVSDWIKNNVTIKALDRPVRPDDIMILVRKRSALVNQIIRALKIRGIPVNGSDRMILTQQICVQDLISAARFALLTYDDLSLAELLKSPLIGMDDQTLEDIAAYRGHEETLWSALQNKADEKIVSYLDKMIALSRARTPSQFFIDMLKTPCPQSDKSGMHAMTGRLGHDIADPVEEFINIVVDFEKRNAASLQLVLQYIEKSSLEIKRDQDESTGQVKIMTVHGAKGLQAPIVILPDTVRTSRNVAGSASSRLLWPHSTGLDVPLWSPYTDDNSDTYAKFYDEYNNKQDEEYRRLLYVAMTRAEYGLFIGGYKGKRTPIEDCWYNYALGAMEDIEGAEQQPFSGEGAADTQKWSYGEIFGEPKVSAAKADSAVQTPLPEWALMPIGPPATTSGPDRPRNSLSFGEAVSPLQLSGNAQRYERGLIIHKLMEYLPNIDSDRRHEMARNYLQRYESVITEDDRSHIVDKVMIILQSDAYKFLFGPNSRAEVGVSGVVNGKIVNAQIDRLVIEENRIVIMDYKSHREDNTDPMDIPKSYQAQLSLYKNLIADIYPDRLIEVYLLWVDGPHLVKLF